MTTSNISPDEFPHPYRCYSTIVERETIKSPFKGDKLDKDNANWIPWRREIQNYLDMIGLSSHLITTPSSIPSPTLQPNAYRNWLSNDRSVEATLNLPLHNLKMNSSTSWITPTNAGAPSKLTILTKVPSNRPT
jgi:hypothetical protein